MSDATLTARAESGLTVPAGSPPVTPLGASRRMLGLALLVFSVLPLFLLLRIRPGAGLAGAATLQNATQTATALWSGFALAVGAGALLGRWISWDALAAPIARIGAWFMRPSDRAFATGSAALAFALTFAYAQLVFGGGAPLIDASSQLLHARYLAAGQLAGPTTPGLEFWIVQNTFVAPGGWASQYPPGYVALMAGALHAGVAWLVGPASAAATVLLTYHALRRLLPGRVLEARLTALTIALCPLLAGQAATYMNHAPATALAALTLYASLRAQPVARWALAGGAVAAAMFAIRPLHGAAIGGALLLGPWLLARLPARATALRLALATLAAAPILAAVALYNARLFGAPAAFGYGAAQGPAQALGFHRDPWGNLYGWIDAVAYTSADLGALGLKLLEAPLPLTAIVAAYLLLARRLARGAWLLVAWATLPLLANFFYWHHGEFLGPRLLAEAAPAWIALGVLALFAGARAAKPALSGTRVAFSPRVAVIGTVAAALLIGGMLLLPPRLAAERVLYGAEPLPELPDESLVFVHGAWRTRIAARLGASGLRLDQLETALRETPACALQQRLDGSAADCAREQAADRAGAIDIAPLLWRHALPGIEDSRALLARDLGPERNGALLRRYPARRAFVLLREHPQGPAVLMPYGEGMQRLWGAP